VRKLSFSPFAHVKSGEGLRVGLMVTCVFMIMTAYYAMKTAREGLILAGGTFGLSGDELKAYATGAMALLLVGIVPAYDLLAERYRRIRVLNISYAVVLAGLVGFWMLGRAGVPLGLPYFVWFGLVSIFLVAQFWSYANDIYTEEQGTRMFAIIATGGALGAIFGPKIAKLFSTFTLMLVAAGILLAANTLLHVIETHLDGKAMRRANKPIEGRGGFALVAGDRGLMMIALMLLVANLVNSTGEYLLSKVVLQHANSLDLGEIEKRELIKHMYSDLYIWMNALTFLIQAFIVSRVMEKIGVRTALFILPMVAFGAYAAIALVGGLAVIRVAKIVENATDYSLQNTVRQALFLPANRAVKYKAKTVIDCFFVRFGDMLSAVLIGIGNHKLDLGTRDLAMINLGLIVVWIVIAGMVARAEGQLASHSSSGSIPLPHSAWVISLTRPVAHLVR
jgi:AAA family ATP:ADP antiporter